jgi:MYXO-CTERM domain-containing protein
MKKPCDLPGAESPRALARRWLPGSILVYASVLTACVGVDNDLALSDSQRPVINGEATPDGHFLSVGGLFTSRNSMCTGTLISPTAVLTAAHCVNPMFLTQPGAPPADDIEYYFTFKRSMRTILPGDVHQVKSVEWHTGFPNIDFSSGTVAGPKQWHDIAVMHLAEPVTDRPVQPILRTADADGVLVTDSEMDVAGYGLTNDEDTMSAGTLHHGTSRINEVGDFEVHAGDGDSQQACRGDSGGPIIARGAQAVQVGVASRLNAPLFPAPTAPPPCESGLLYTRVDSYYDWIAERVPDLGRPVQPPESQDPSDPGTDDDGDQSDQDRGDDGDLPADPDGQRVDEAGCGCRTTGGPPSPGTGLLFVAVVLGLGMARRRGNQRRRRVSLGG